MANIYKLIRYLQIRISTHDTKKGWELTMLIPFSLEFLLDIDEDLMELVDFLEDYLSYMLVLCLDADKSTRTVLCVSRNKDTDNELNY